MEKILGIDLGTTNSVISIMENGEPIVVPNRRGDRVTPSVVAFTKNDETLVGRSAKNQVVINADKTIVSVKRKMGSSEEISVGNKQFKPQEISAKILASLKSDAEEYLGEEIHKAVITVPAYFDDNQRSATKEAGKIAGLEVVRIINEPTSAALAYGFDKDENSNILIYDLGGGTFDVSILEIDGGVFEVKSTCGNNKLGGDDFDNRLLELILREYNEKEGIDLTNDKMAIQKLKEDVEKAKIELSEVMETEINVPFISADENGPKHLKTEIKRSVFEDLIADYIEETLRLTEQAVADANLEMKDIGKVILVGGSTKIPFVREKVKELVGKENKKGINPDECVAIGAAIQAAILSGEKKGVVLVDVTPLSLGIEIEGGIFIPIIERNTPIPTSSNKLFTTIADNQRSVEIHILQGERVKCSENISLGKFQLSGIRKAKRGTPRIEVSFNIDVDGIVSVQAKDLDTGNEQQITITNASSLSEEEIQNIIEESKNTKDEDNIYFEKEKKRSTLKINIENLKKSYQENYENLDDSLRNEINEFIGEVEEELENAQTQTSIEEISEMLDRIDFFIEEIKTEVESRDLEYDSVI